MKESSSTPRNRRSAAAAAEINAIERITSKKKQKTDNSNDNPKRTATLQPQNLANMPPLINLGKLIRGTLVKRPSATIKSPYVADVSLCPLANNKNNQTKQKMKKNISTDNVEKFALAHAPALDVGGLCSVGAEVHMTERPPGGKTSHAIELVKSSGKDDSEKGVLIGAHPRLGELIALEVLKRGLLKDALPLENGFAIGPVDEMIESKTKEEAKKRKLQAKNGDRTDVKPINNSSIEDETVNDDESTKSKIYLKQQATLGDSRVDFEMTLTNPLHQMNHRVIFEVKNVVCADYEAGTEPVKMGTNHCVVVAPASDGNYTYRRSALFPWARTRGQTFEGKKVCSERALKHLRNLESLTENNVTTVVLFIVNREDCESVRACHEACPVFKEVLESVVKAGVKALGVRVRWTEDGECFYDGLVPVQV